MADPISLLIWLIILIAVLYLLFYLLGKVTLPEPVRVVITVAVALVVLLWLVQRFGLI